MGDDEFDIESLFEEHSDYLDERIGELEESLEREKDQRKEERFLWCLVSVILLNVFVFTSMEGSVFGPLVIGVFEAVALLLLARKLGLEEVTKMVNGLIAMISRSPK